MLDHSSPDYLDELMKISDGRGVDIILEMLANVNLGQRSDGAREERAGDRRRQSRQDRDQSRVKR